MIEPREIERMSIAARLKAIEDIWDSPYRFAEGMPSPDWHQDVLTDRKARAEQGEAKFLTLDQLRALLMNASKFV